jgi:glutamate-1-semialdehyde 2,1-aminomutase
MLTPFFVEGPVTGWDDAAKCDTKRFGTWHAQMLARGVLWPPAQFEAAFVSIAHDDAALEKTADAARAAFAAVA